MPTSKELKSRMSKTEKDIQKLKDKLAKDTSLLFRVSFAEIFKEHKNLDSFAWTQYTPHWNDGDTCVFSAHKEYIYLNGAEEPESLWDIESFYKDLIQKDKVIKKLKTENTKLAKSKDSKWQIESNERRIKELEEADVSKVEWKLKALRDIIDVMDSADDEVLLEMFSDHVKVVVTADGIETESYEHD